MIVKFKILRGIKINNRITSLNFRKADLGHFICSLEAALESRGVQKSWLVFKVEAQELFIPMYRKLGKHGNRLARVNMELLTGLDHEKEVHRRRKQGEALWEEYSLKKQSEES